ncbi:MAG TPA: hypothetical protein VHR45_20800 [Thermoanaerobaculia bacterium]|nr:hypothetical protein [Thermoanaerobaculia bacterium]
MNQPATQRFLDLVERVASGETAQSENDLSRQIPEVFSDLGLYPVFESAGRTGSRKRPDIRAYSRELDADLGLPAEVPEHPALHARCDS